MPHARAIVQHDAGPLAQHGPSLPLDVAPDDPRLGPLAEEIATRFARCRDAMPPATFEQLVRRAAWIRLRWTT